MEATLQPGQTSFCRRGALGLIAIISPALTFTLCIYIFLNGFFLTRLAVTDRSKALFDELSNSGKFSKFSGCLNGREMCTMEARHLEPKFDRAVWLLIDALRYNFLSMSEASTTQEIHPFQNNFRLLHNTLQLNPGRGKIFKFLADPPTTTMQRIKGLTTGSLPTFLDMANNFGSYEIIEDSIIDQLKSAKKRAVFVGDETWLDLFPSSFAEAHALPSFNVKDLHSVDNKVINYTLETMQSKNFDLLIGHCLGVDHCGHTYGPFHKKMKEKLVQMDEFINDVIKQLDNQTLLVVMGDHGMTGTGDHGGDSHDEVAAGLLLYANREWLTKKTEEVDIMQIDLVPTLSLLLGLPIPFSNLGSLIPNIFNSTYLFPTSRDCDVNCTIIRQKENAFVATQMNSQQVLSYIKSYNKASGNMLHLVSNLEEQLTNSAKRIMDLILVQPQNSSSVLKYMEELDHTTEQLHLLLNNVRKACEDVWVKFDTLLMIQGILTGVVLTLVLSWSIVANTGNDILHSGFPSTSYLKVLSLVLTIVGLILSFSSWKYQLQCQCATMYCSLLLTLLSSVKFSRQSKRFMSLWISKLQGGFDYFAAVFLVSILLFYSLCVFSNSYAVHEDKVTLFILQCLVFLQFLRSVMSWSVKKGVQKEINRGPKTAICWNLPSFYIIGFILLLLLNVRLTGNLNSCREEQIGCEPSDFASKLSLIIEQSANKINVRLSTALVTVVTLYMSIHIILKQNGNIAKLHLVSIVWKALVPVVMLCLLFQWILQAYTNDKVSTMLHLPFVHQVLLPRAVFLLVAIIIALLGWDPLALIFIFQRSSRELKGQSSANALSSDLQKIHQIYREVKAQLEDSDSQKCEKAVLESEGYCAPHVYGLGTSYSSSFLVIVFTIATALMTTLGDGCSVGLVLQLSIGYLFLQLSSLDGHLALVERVIFWSFLTSSGFFMTGHQSAISSIRFEAGFLGLSHDEKEVILPALLILVNTYASHIICAFTLPMLVICKSAPMYKCLVKEEVDTEKREVLLHEHPYATFSVLGQLASLYILLRMIKLLAIATAAAVHRRHLMVWKIFAPRFLFEACGFLVALPCVVLGYLFFLRVDATLRTRLRGLQDDLGSTPFLAK